MRLWAVVVLLLSSARPAQAACVLLPLEQLMNESSTAWVFSGTVREVSRVAAGQVAAIDVDGVWKGTVSARVLVYNRQEDLEERTDFQLQERYLVITYVQSTADRAQFGVTDERTTYEANGCTIQPFSSDYAKMILGNTPSRPPSQKP
jgi:hypothetical protein